MNKVIEVSRYKLILNGIILAAILFLTFWIRLQVPSDIPDGQFTSQDAYVFRDQINEIVEHGSLPIKKERWEPGCNYPFIFERHRSLILNVIKI